MDSLIITGTSHGGKVTKAKTNDTGVNWHSVNEDVAFNLSDTVAASSPVPEPSSLVLLDIGLCVTALASGRRRRT